MKNGIFEKKISLFHRISKVDEPPQIVRLGDHLLDIMQGKYKALVTQLRSLEYGSDEFDRFKRGRLPAAVFSGVLNQKMTNSDGAVSYRVEGCCSEHTNLMVLDIDVVENAAQLRDSVANKEYTIASWISPSGKGVKILVEINDYRRHSQCYSQLMTIYPNIDKATSDIYRACFVSYDPGMKVNMNHKVFEYKEVTTQELAASKQYQQAPQKYYNSVKDNALKTITDIILSSYQGNRNNSLLRAAIIAGNYIQKGIIPEDEAIRVMLFNIEQKGETNEKRNFDTIKRGIEYGKRNVFVDNVHKLTALIKNENHPAIIEAGDVDDFFVSRDNVLKDVETFLSGGFKSTQPFLPIHRDSCDKAILKNGYMYVVTGHSNIGKTTIMLFLISQIVALYKKKVMMYVQEDRAFSCMVQIIQFWGKNHIADLKNHYRDLYNKYIDFFFENIYLIDNKKTLFSYEDILNIGIQRKVDVLLVDPYNSLMVNSKEAYSFHYKALRSMSLFCSQTNTTLFVNAHPNTNAQRRRVNGVIQRPYVTDIEYGSMFKNVCDEAYVFHRDPFNPSKEKKNEVSWYIEKIRDKHIFGGDLTDDDNPIIMNYDRYRFFDRSRNDITDMLIL